jgi:hypothetical protein
MKIKKEVLTALGAIFIVSLLISAVTAVPQQNAEILNDQIDKKEKMNTFIDVIEGTENSDTSTILFMSFLLNIADQLIREIQNEPDQLKLSDELIYDSIPDIDEITTEKDISYHTLSTLQNLKDRVAKIDDTDGQKMDLSILKSLITLLISFIKEKLLAENTTADDGDNANNDWMSTLKEILKVFASILAFLLQGLLKGISLLIGGILRIIAAILTIVVLMLAGLQTILTVSGFLLVFMGFMSKIGLKIFSVIAAPVFALLAAQFTVSMGTLLGGLSMALHAILAFVLIFAIPILLIVGIFYLMGGNSDEDDGGLFDFITLHWDGPMYMLLSILLNKLSA